MIESCGVKSPITPPLPDSIAVSVASEECDVEALREQLDRKTRALQAFQDISVALTSPQNPDRLFDLVLSRAAVLLDADRATIFLVDETSGQLRSMFSQGGCEQPICLAPGQGIAGMVLQDGEAIRAADAYRDARFSREWDEQTGYHTRSILAVPMKNYHGNTIGVLQVLNKRQAQAFTKHDESLLTLLASQAAIFLDNVTLYVGAVRSNQELAKLSQTLERKVRSLNLLLDLETSMTRAGDLERLVSTLLKSVLTATSSKASAVLLQDAQQNTCEAFVVEAADASSVRKIDVPRPVGSFAKVMKFAKPVYEKDVSRTRATAQLGLSHLRAHRLLAVPMFQQDDVFGVLAVYDHADGSEFNQDDEELMRLVASSASADIRLLWSRQAQQVSDRLSTIGSLLSSVLHDMKTPMAVIGGYVQMTTTTDDSELRKQYGALVLQQLEYITAMQREVLAFARGERTLLISKVYLERFMEEFATQLRKGLEGRPVHLEMELRDRGVARFDQVKMTRALYNLATNAVQAMGTQGGTLSIVVERREKQLEFRVSDTGPGVPEPIKNRLFGHFVTANKRDGTGLGLAIVKKIMQEHGGSVTMRSTNQGAEFTLHLPQ